MKDRKINRRSLLQLAGMGTGVSLLSAGSMRNVYAQGANDIDKAIEWAKAALPNSTPDIIAGAAKEGKLSLLLQQIASDEAIIAMISKFKEHYPFIDVSYTTQSTAQFVNKFNAELNAKRGISDYLQLPPGLVTADYLKQGALAEFVVSEDAAFPAGGKQSGIWYAWYRQFGATAYRAGSLSDEEKELIRTYKGLSDPRFKGRLGVNGITNFVSQAGVYVLLNDPDQTIWEGLVANQPRVKPSSAALMDGLLGGEYDISILGGFGNAASAAQQGAPVEFIITAPAAVQYVPGAVSALAPNPNAARLWQDWAMSKEGQEMWSSQVGTISARDDVNVSWAVQQPWFYLDNAGIKDLDWTDFAAQQTQNVDRFKKDFQAG